MGAARRADAAGLVCHPAHTCGARHWGGAIPRLPTGAPGDAALRWAGGRACERAYCANLATGSGPAAPAACCTSPCSQPAHCPLRLPPPPLLPRPAGTGLLPAYCYLFFGCRHEAGDFLYRSEWKQMIAERVLAPEREGGLVTAFSRDQPSKVYVQHRIRERAAALWRLLQERGAAPGRGWEAGRVPSSLVCLTNCCAGWAVHPACPGLRLW